MAVVPFPELSRMPVLPAEPLERLDGLMQWLRHQIEETVPLTQRERIAITVAIEAVQAKIEDILLD